MRDWDAAVIAAVAVVASTEYLNVFNALLNALDCPLHFVNGQYCLCGSWGGRRVAATATHNNNFCSVSSVFSSTGERSATRVPQQRAATLQ
jgi:hypothetical protein